MILVLPLGDKPLTGIADTDIRACALALFRLGDAAIGRRLGIASGHLTGVEMAAALAHALGEPVHYEAIPIAQYAQSGFPGAADLANMFQFKHD